MTKLEAAARQIIVDWDSGIHLYEAITALREALGYCVDEGCPHKGTTHTCVNPLAEQVHTPYCKQAPMCKTPCGNSDCVEQPEQEPVAKVFEYALSSARQLLDYADDSDGCQYGTLSTSLVRDAMEQILPALIAAPQSVKQEPVIRATLAPPAPPEVYQMRSKDAYEAGWWEAQRQKAVSPIAPAQQVEQEPVGTAGELFTMSALERLDVRPSTKVYLNTAPVHTKDLTDDEIFKLFYSDGKEPIDHYEFARAVIAAYKEKNK